MWWQAATHFSHGGGAMLQVLEINFAAVIVERQGYLDGGRLFVLEGEDQPAQGWRLSFSMRWPVATERVEEGDVTLSTPVGDELYGSLRAGTAAEITDEDGVVGAARLDLLYDVTGSEGAFGDAGGTVQLTGTLAGEGAGSGGSFAGEGALLTVRLELAGAPDLGAYQPATHVPPGAP